MMRAAGVAVLIAFFTGGNPVAWGGEERGEALYALWCARCHGSDARGEGRDAAFFANPPPPLVGTLVLARYTDTELVGWVREGKRPNLGLRPERLREHARGTEDIYRYLRRLPEVDWDRAEPGREAYAARCLPCHDDYGRPQAGLPSSPRDLSDRGLQSSLTDEELALRIRHEREGMPALARPPDETALGQLVAFVRLLSPGYELYDRFCLGCHGLRGEGVPDAPVDSGRPAFAFDERYFRKHGSDWVVDRVWHMLREAKTGMPHFAQTLEGDDVREILRYLRTIEP